jgi:hypothetical protein
MVCEEAPCHFKQFEAASCKKKKYLAELNFSWLNFSDFDFGWAFLGLLGGCNLMTLNHVGGPVETLKC